MLTLVFLICSAAIVNSDREQSLVTGNVNDANAGSVDCATGVVMFFG